MRWLVLSVLLASCADGMTLSMNAPDPGQAHDGGTAGGGGSADGGAGGGDPACSAAVETLSGQATFVAGSLAAANASDQDCADWAAGNQAAVHDVTVTNGKIDDAHPLEMRSATPAGGTCLYLLRETLGPVGVAIPCAVTADFLLAVP